MGTRAETPQELEALVGLGTTNYLYDGMDFSANVIEEVDNSGTVLARYARSLELDEHLAEFRSGVASYFQEDGLNSVTSLSTSAGTIANTYTYDSFGRLAASTGTLTNPFQYTGREFDSEAGLYYNRARYYDGTVGRFMTEDPIRLKGGINFYSYANNRANDFGDPSGLRIDWGGYVFSNPQVVSNFEKLNSLIDDVEPSDDCVVLRVTGGDRYRDPDDPKVIRSATNDAVIPNADPHSPHLDENGARAIDFVVENQGQGGRGRCGSGEGCWPLTDSDIDVLLLMTDFAPYNTRRNYPEGPHTHVNLPNLPRFY